MSKEGYDLDDIPFGDIRSKTLDIDETAQPKENGGER